jgi:hypothetical protein
MQYVVLFYWLLIFISVKIFKTWHPVPPAPTNKTLAFEADYKNCLPNKISYWICLVNSWSYVTYCIYWPYFLLNLGKSYKKSWKSHWSPMGLNFPIVLMASCAIIAAKNVVIGASCICAYLEIDNTS